MCGTICKSNLLFYQIRNAALSCEQSIAITENGINISYNQLDRLLDQLVTILQAKLEENITIIIYMNRSINSVLSILAALKLGLNFVPVDSNIPPERLCSIINNYHSFMLLFDDSTLECIKDLEYENYLKVCYITLGKNKKVPPVEPILVDGSRTAYTIFTSGSTGTPKGVIIRRDSLFHYLDWACNTLIGEDTTTFPCFTSLSFDLTLTLLLTPFLLAKRLIIYQDCCNKSALENLIDDNQVDIIKVTPSHLFLLKQYITSDSKIKRIIVGGEQLSKKLADIIYKKLNQQVLIYNEYGPTETTIACSYHQYDPNDSDYSCVPIGKAIEGFELIVLDENGNQASAYKKGEIYVNGCGLAKGYLNQLKLTTEKFIYINNRRFYKTGDIAFKDENGRLIYVGRNDNQVKIRGYRIELGDIQSVLESHPLIQAAAVVTRSTIEQSYSSNHCRVCGISQNYPDINFDDTMLCKYCRNFPSYSHIMSLYFDTRQNLEHIIAKIKEQTQSNYDCIVVFSGGKDSSYMLCKLKEYGLTILAVTLDTGFISQFAKQNIHNIVNQLGIDHTYVTTPYMNEIYRESLDKFATTNNGAFKALYNTAMVLAYKLRINYIFTGLSRGQLFETRLSELIKSSSSIKDRPTLEQKIIEGRMMYHAIQDVPSKIISEQGIDVGELINSINFIDFYRFFDVSLDDIYCYLTQVIGWKKPKDTGRSTDCLINDIGIYVHYKRRGYHNYSLPYSWDVRVGHKTRESAIYELSDLNEISESKVKEVLQSIGYSYDEEQLYCTKEQLVAYFISTEKNLSIQELKSFLTEHLPIYMIPSHFKEISHIPVTINGKIDISKLPYIDFSCRNNRPLVSVRSKLESELHVLWSEILEINSIGIDDNFFELGGNSIPAVILLFKIHENYKIQISMQAFLQTPTIRELARIIENQHKEE